MRADAVLAIEPRPAILRRELFAAAARERTDTAEFLSLIGEFDALRLYVEEGYSSMHTFCIGALRLCEESAYKRIQAARAARKFPALLPALVEGRLHLSAIFLLAPHLSPDNVDELISAATHKSIRDIREWIAQRVLTPEPELALTEPASGEDATPVEPSSHDLQLETFPVAEEPSETPETSAPQRVGPPARCDVYAWVDREKLEYARALLSHVIPTGDLDQVLDRALDALIREVEGRKFGASARPRSRGRRNAPRDARSIPAHVKREVWRRDQGRCTFVGRDGHRCGERRFLEYDHARPVALGGQATVEDLRLRCRPHNQYDAERVFGPGFMAGKREAAQRARAEVRASRESREVAEMQRERTDRVRSIASGLRNLGCRADQAKHAAETAVAAMRPGEPLEDTLRTALKSLAPPRSTHRDERPTASAPLETVQAVAARSVEDLVPV